MRTYDVIVVGGGLAGITAARDLGEGGDSVLLLEARERLGGRTYYRRFAGTEHEVEFGGTWIAPRWQGHVAREVGRYGLALTESPNPESRVFLVGGRRLAGPDPVPEEDKSDLERVIAHLAAASRRLDSRVPLARPVVDLDVTFADFLKKLSLRRATRDYVAAWISGGLGCEAHEVSALHVLALVAGHDHDPRAWFGGESEIHKFAGGTRSLVEAMVEDSGAEVRLSSPVHRIEQSSDGVEVTMYEGDSYSASAAIVAVPLNVLKNLEFSPELGEAKRAAAREGHAGHSVKLWALVTDAPRYFGGQGRGPRGAVWLGTEYEVGEGSLMAGFGSDPRRLDALDPGHVQDVVEAFVPGAKVLEVDAHPWNSDPYSMGTWTAFRPGQLARFGPALREPEGRLAFAGADFAVGWTGYIDGAIESGARAARYAKGLSGRPAKGASA